MSLACTVRGERWNENGNQQMIMLTFPRSPIQTLSTSDWSHVCRPQQPDHMAQLAHVVATRSKHVQAQSDKLGKQTLFLVRFPERETDEDGSQRCPTVCFEMQDNRISEAGTGPE
jgi:hypothetical protein